MFRCNFCNQLSKPGEGATRVVVATRTKTYPAREQAMKQGRGLHKRWIADPGGEGIEIVREELRHEGCA